MYKDGKIQEENKSWYKSYRLQIIAIVVLSLIIRIMAFTIAIHRDGFYHQLYGLRTEVARNVMKGNWFKWSRKRFFTYQELIYSSPSGWVDFNKIEDDNQPEKDLSPFQGNLGYSVLAGLIWKCLGKIDWKPIILLQIAIDSLMCFLLYSIGKKIGDERKGLLVAFLFALFPLEIYIVIMPKYDIWVSFFYISCVYLLLQEQEQKNKWISVAIIVGIGILSAYTAWIRSTVVLFFVVIGLYFLLTKREKFQWVKVAVLVAVFGCTFIIPRLSYSHIYFGQFNITRGYKWWPFYCGLGQFENDFGMDGTDGSATKYCLEKDTTLTDKAFWYNRQRVEELLEARVKEIIRENPLWYIGTVLKRAGVIIFPGFYYHKAGIFKFISPSILIFLQISLVIWSLLFLFGFYIGLRRDFNIYIVILLPYLYTLVTLSPFFVQGRNITNIYFIQFFGGIEALWYLKEKVSIDSIFRFIRYPLKSEK